MASRALVAVLFLSASLSGCLTEGKRGIGERGRVGRGRYSPVHRGRDIQLHRPRQPDEVLAGPRAREPRPQRDRPAHHRHARIRLELDEHRKLSSFDDIADEVGAIVVYPDGVAGYNMQWDLEENQAWNSGWCCAHSTRDEIDDVGFIERVVEISLGMYNVDEDRVYASGWSNGCSMSQRLAMESSHIFAAVGCMAFYLITEPVDGYSPIPVMEVHGFLDNVVLYESTVLSVPFNEALWTNSEAYDTGAIENMVEWGEPQQLLGGAGDLRAERAVHDTGLRRLRERRIGAADDHIRGSAQPVREGLRGRHAHREHLHRNAGPGDVQPHSLGLHQPVLQGSRARSSTGIRLL